jgi:hypothetical protein
MPASACLYSIAGGKMRRYRNKFEMVAHILFLGMLIVVVAVWIPVSQALVDEEWVRYAIVLAAAVPIWFVARWVTRRFGLEDE